ncbi:hypothetical protein ACFL6Y_05160 [Elusimicrobiota bacterium]
MMINKKTKFAITAGLLLGFQPILWANLDMGIDPMNAIHEESISSLDVAFAGAQEREGGYFPVNSQEREDYRILPFPDFPDYGKEDCEFNPVLDCAQGYRQECGRCVPDIHVRTMRISQVTVSPDDAVRTGAVVEGSKHAKDFARNVATDPNLGDTAKTAVKRAAQASPLGQNGLPSGWVNNAAKNLATTVVTDEKKEE